MNALLKFFILFILFSLNNLNIKATTKYYSYLNNFGSFGFAGVLKSDNSLEIENSTTNPIIISETTDIKDSKFNIHFRIANTNNNAGKSYKVIDKITNKVKSIINPTWGVMWNCKNNHNYHALRLQSINTNLHDILDERLMSIELIECKNGDEKIISSTTVSKGVDLNDKYNVIEIAFDGVDTKLSIGNKILTVIKSIESIDYQGEMAIGLYVGAGAKVKLDRITTNSSPFLENTLRTNWSLDSINKYLLSSTNPIEGIWEVYDCNLNEKKLRLGGKYKIALISNHDGGYDILYINGARVNENKWESCMIKGKLTPSRFNDNFGLLWYDSMMKPFNDDCFAIFENSVLLNLSFPTENSEIRFVKCLN